jgi:hypothetical protein
VLAREIVGGPAQPRRQEVGAGLERAAADSSVEAVPVRALAAADRDARRDLAARARAADDEDEPARA